MSALIRARYSLLKQRMSPALSDLRPGLCHSHYLNISPAYRSSRFQSTDGPMEVLSKQRKQIRGRSRRMRSAGAMISKDAGVAPSPFVGFHQMLRDACPRGGEYQTRPPLGEDGTDTSGGGCEIIICGSSRAKRSGIQVLGGFGGVEEFRAYNRFNVSVLFFRSQ